MLYRTRRSWATSCARLPFRWPRPISPPPTLGWLGEEGAAEKGKGTVVPNATHSLSHRTRQTILENVNKAQVRVRTATDNVAGLYVQLDGLGVLLHVSRSTPLPFLIPRLPIPNSRQA